MQKLLLRSELRGYLFYFWAKFSTISSSPAILFFFQFSKHALSAIPHLSIYLSIFSRFTVGYVCWLIYSTPDASVGGKAYATELATSL